jgi:Destabilase
MTHKDTERDGSREREGLTVKRCVVLQFTVLSLIAGTVQAGIRASGQSDIDRLLDAIASVESNANPRAVGDRGRALGAFQIHKRYWRDGTRFLGVSWSYDLARDPAKARQVVRAYLRRYGKGKTLLQMARIHNGGPRGHRKKATLKYARKIAKALERSQRQS